MRSSRSGKRHDRREYRRRDRDFGRDTWDIERRDPEAIEATVGRVVQEWGRVDVHVANAGGGRGMPVDTKASTLDPALLQLVTEMNPVRDRVFV